MFEAEDAPQETQPENREGQQQEPEQHLEVDGFGNIMREVRAAYARDVAPQYLQKNGTNTALVDYLAKVQAPAGGAAQVLERPNNENETARPAQAGQQVRLVQAEENTLAGMVAERYDRQARIRGWDQKKIEDAVLTIIGYNIFSEYLALSASALGIRRISIIATPQDLPSKEAPMLRLSGAQDRQGRLAEMVKKVGDADLEFLVASMTSTPEKYLLSGSGFVVDATGRHESRALALQFAEEGDKAHTEIVHFSGNGFLMLSHVDNLNPLYGKATAAPDAVNAMLAAGITLEEIKKSAFGKCGKKETIVYEFGNAEAGKEDYAPYKVLLIGAGALGNFVGQGLAALGFNLVDVLDFDTIETTNLNRQLLFYNSVGQQKARVLAERCAAIRGQGAKYEYIIKRFDQNFDIRKYDLVIDCVDNFETREIISWACVNAKVPLVSGGTSYSAGQAVAYVPGVTGCSDHMLGLKEKAAAAREMAEQREREGTGCIVQPNPSVIMSNQIIAGMMLDLIRQAFNPKIFGAPFCGQVGYRAEGQQRLGRIEINSCGD